MHSIYLMLLLSNSALVNMNFLDSHQNPRLTYSISTIKAYATIATVIPVLLATHIDPLSSLITW